MSVASAVIELDTKDSPVYRIPQCRKRPREHRLSPAGRQYRLDRHIARDGQRLGQELPDAPHAGRLAADTGRAKDAKSMDLSDLIEASAIMPALEGELQEAASANAFREGGRHHRHAGARDFRHDPAARAAGLDRRRQRHRHPARQARRRQAHHRRVRRLETPVDFEALDDQPVDLVFLLLAPEGAGADHSRRCRALPACCATATRSPRSAARSDASGHPRAAVGHAGLARRLRGLKR